MMTIYTPDTAPLPPPPLTRGAGRPSLPARGSSTEPDETFRRPLMQTIRRHRLLLWSAFCILASLIFLAAPLLGRSYDITGTMKVVVRPFERMPELNQVADAVLRDTRKSPANRGIEATASRSDAGTSLLQLSASGPTRHVPFVQLHTFATEYAESIRQTVDQRLEDYRAGLEKKRDQLTRRHEELTSKIENFRDTHSGFLPDDPSSVVNRFNELKKSLDDKQQRLGTVSEYLNRLRESKRTSAAPGVAPPPAPLPPPVAEAAAPSKPENDPEVVALTAQLQLLNDQIDKQLESRTEQHPYVQDLRTQQTNLQKKLESAKQRAATGAPAPANVRPLAPPSAAGAGDQTLLAAQNVDLAIAAAQSEQDTLKVAILGLTSERDALKKEVDRVMPARREYEGMTAELEKVKKDLPEVESRIAEYDLRFGSPDEKVLPGSIRLQEPPVEVSAFSLGSSSTLPRFPSLPLIYACGLLLGLVGAGALALLMQRTDRTFQHPQEVAALLEVPLLGTVSEIRTPGQHWRRRLWKTVGRPVLSVMMALLLARSAMLCYEHLADTTFLQKPKLLASSALETLSGAPLSHVRIDS